METGTLRWFKPYESTLPARMRTGGETIAQGELYGFIQPDKFGLDLLVRARDLSLDVLPHMKEDAKVAFARGSFKGREFAMNVTVVAKPRLQGC